MTSKRNLGPILAMAGAAIVGAAVVAGFIAVGGPGDARDRRLDEQTMGKIMSSTEIAQCAFNVSAAAPASPEEATQIFARSAAAGKQQNCSQELRIDLKDMVKTGGQPTAPGDVVYEKLGKDRIRLCGNFRRPFDPSRPPPESYGGWRDVFYPNWRQPRPNSGVYCYNIDLVSQTVDDSQAGSSPEAEPR